MNEWQETLQIDHDIVEAEVRLTFLQQTGPVRLSFNVNTTTVEQAKDAEATVNHVLSRLSSLEEVVADAAFKHYLFLVKAFHDSYGDTFQLPEAADAEELQALYQLTAIYFSSDMEEGYFGLGFECAFEEEHGMGIRFRSWQIEEVGGEDEAFSLD